jgi:8-oxo-dGTP pyrophosphatase MutT (NUDIX family)
MASLPYLNVAVVILHDPEGRILLHKRKGEDQTDVEGFWLLPGGTIEEGESPGVAIRREIGEELGYELTNPRPFAIQDFHIEGKADGRRHIFAQKCEDCTQIRSLEDFELQWIHPDKIEGVKTLDAVPELFNLLKTDPNYL